MLYNKKGRINGIIFCHQTGGLITGWAYNRNFTVSVERFSSCSGDWETPTTLTPKIKCTFTFTDTVETAQKRVEFFTIWTCMVDCEQSLIVQVGRAKYIHAHARKFEETPLLATRILTRETIFNIT